MKRFVGIDPSTKTGLAIIDENGNLIDAFEITASGKDPGRMVDIIAQTVDNVEPGDFVTIEGFGFASQAGFLLGGIGWGIRMELFDRDIDYLEVAPAALKKFASGKGNTDKDALAVEIYKRWGFEHKSDNVRDAYVLAQIARANYLNLDVPAFQQEVIEAITNPPAKKAKKKKGA
ncbi:MAG TPA: hypothetical protein VE710_18245 [Candidatus Bathyarchaeia archaeon]|nr:hypothetical protein [Candidatus Bathyarchaeia archaeon]